MSKVVSFFNDVKLELNKVSWPTWDDLKNSTYVVLNLSLILILFLFFVDMVLSKILSYTVIYGLVYVKGYFR